MIHFLSPYMLMLLLLLVPLGVVARRQPGQADPDWAWNRRGSLCLRSLSVVALTGALAGTEVMVGDHDLTVVYLLDRSDSISIQQRARAEAYLRQALAQLPPDDQAGVVVFGQRALVERAPSHARTLGRIADPPSGSYTNIADAIHLALGLLPATGQRRLVLLSDGGANAGDTASAARMAAARGVPLDVVDLGDATALPDVAISGASLPPAARIGQQLKLSVSTAATASTTAHLTIHDNGRLVLSRQVQVQRGYGQLDVDLPEPTPAFNRYEVRLTAPGDARPENDVAETYSMVSGRPNVLLVERTPGEARNLQDALAAASFRTTTLSPNRMPTTMAALSDFDATVLINVPLQEIPPAAARLLPAYVRDLGRGLAMIGGDHSFGAGGYGGSPIEEALPVSMQARPRMLYPAVAVVVVIDVSGSMGKIEDGVTKVQLAAQGAGRIAANLRDGDEITIIPFDSQPEGTIGPRPGRARDDVIAQVKQVTSGGIGINMDDALAEAARYLRASDKPVRHLITITDGDDSGQQAGSRELVRALNDEGVTLTTIAVGDGADTAFLREIAQAGGGQFFLTQRAAQIPDILLDETRLLIRPLLTEGAFMPRAGAVGAGSNSGLLQGLGSLPPLDGYVASSPKQRAQVLLWTPQDEPLLATWQYGLGRSLAWTSDMKGQWGHDLVRWGQFPRLAAQLIGWLVPPPGSPRLTLEARPSGDQLILSANARDDQGRPVDGLQLVGELLDGDGSTRPVMLRAIAPGNYGAIVDGADPGTYQLRVVAYGHEGQLFAAASGGTVLPGGHEYADNTGGDGLLASLARDTGGRVNPTPTGAYDPAGAALDAPRELAMPLLWLALLLLPIDIALRRLLFPKRGSSPCTDKLE